jgi:hypothetical protein
MYFYCYVYVFLLYVYVWLTWLKFFHAFSSVVRQMPGWNPQRRGTKRTLPNFCVVLCIVCFVSFYVLFVCICVLYYCHRVATQLQLTNISYFKFLLTFKNVTNKLTWLNHSRTHSLIHSLTDPVISRIEVHFLKLEVILVKRKLDSISLLNNH